VAAGVTVLRHCVALVDRAGVFSSNETKDDIATSDLKFVLAPFYLAEVVSRTRTTPPVVVGGEGSSGGSGGGGGPPSDPGAARLPIVAEAAENTELFLAMCERHDLLSKESRETREREGAANQATARAEKVARFKRDKAIRLLIEELELGRRRRREDALANADWDDEDPECADVTPQDEEEERQRWMLLLEDAVQKSLDAQPQYALEMEMLRNREALSAARPQPPPRQQQQAPQVIGQLGSAGGGRNDAGGVAIPRELLAALGSLQGGGMGSRERMKSEVFRPSHSLPTMTIEEAGEIEYQELVERTAREAGRKMQREREEALMTRDEIDDAELAKKRAWDEFTDDNPFGAGNNKLRPCS